jgi:acetoin utilization protein AcuB
VRVEEWMTMEMETVKPRDSVAHARALLEERRINQLPVVVNGRLVGIVTDRDLRDAVSTATTASSEAAGARPELVNPDSIPVEAVMSAKALFVRPDDMMEKAAALMRRERIGALPVLEGRALRGIITRSDVLKAFIELAGTRRTTVSKRAPARAPARPPSGVKLQPKAKPQARKKSQPKAERRKRPTVRARRR